MKKSLLFLFLSFFFVAMYAQRIPTKVKGDLKVDGDIILKDTTIENYINRRISIHPQLWDSINKANDSIRVQYQKMLDYSDSIASLRAAMTNLSPVIPVVPSHSDTVYAKNYDYTSYTTSFTYPIKQVVSEVSSDTAMGYMNNGAYFGFRSYDFPDNTNRMKMYHIGHPDYLSDFEIRLNSPNGTLVSTFTHESSGGWTTAAVQTVELSQTISGEQDVYIKSLGNSNGIIYWLYFYNEPETDTDPPLITSSTVYDTAKADIYFTTNEALETLTSGGWSLSADSGAVTVSSASLNTPTSFNLGVSRDFKYGEAIQITYSQASGNVTDSAGNELNNLTRFVNNLIEGGTSPQLDTTITTDTIYFKNYDAADGFLINTYNSGAGDDVVDHFVPSAWLRFDNVSFSNTDSISLRYARDNNGNEMQFRINSSDGTLIADPDMPVTGDSLTFSTIKFPLTQTLTGTYDLYVISETWNGSTLHYLTYGTTTVEDTTTTPPPTFSGDGDYYFSSINGNDSNSGTSSSTPKQTISALQSLINSGLQAGDTVLIERGSVYNLSQLEFNSVAGTLSEPIVFATYGSGDDPIISGGKDVSSTFAQNGNIWTSTSVGYTVHAHMDNPAGLLINGQYYRVARHPNHPTYYTTTTNGDNYLEDGTQSWTTNSLVRGQVAARAVSWGWSVGEITSNTSTTIDFEAFGDYGMDGTTYYFLQNVDLGLDQVGEWTYDDTDLKVYYTSNLNTQEVEIPVQDTVLKINNSSHIEFNNIEFRCANSVLVDMSSSTNIDFDECVLQVANVGMDINNCTGLDITNSIIQYFGTNGIMTDGTGDTRIESNYFKFAPGYRGGQTHNYDRAGAALTHYYGNDEFWVKYNVFDSTALAFQTHWANGDWYFERNLIKNYGIIHGDIGAIYMGGDWRTDITKRLRKNIIIDAFDNSSTYSSGHPTAWAHAIYTDYGVSGIIIDSNTVVNTNVAIQANRSDGNFIRNNKFVNCAKDINSDWAAAVFYDNITETAEAPIVNTLTGNTFVFGNNVDEVGINYHESDAYPFQWGSNVLNNNMYQDPFTYSSGGNKVHREWKSYGVIGEYSTTEMCSRRGYDCSSTFNALDWKFDDVTGITEDEFIKIVYNASRVSKLLPLNHTFIDLNGVTYNTNIQLEPYETKILFYYAP